MKDLYNNEIKDALMKEFNYASVMEAPEIREDCS